MAAEGALRVVTYGVAPITPQLGLVEFVPGARPLDAVLCPDYVPQQVMADTAKGWDQWVTSYGQHKLGVLGLPRAEVVGRLGAAQVGLRFDGMREALLRGAGGWLGVGGLTGCACAAAC